MRRASRFASSIHSTSLLEPLFSGGKCATHSSSLATAPARLALFRALFQPASAPSSGQPSSRVSRPVALPPSLLRAFSSSIVPSSSAPEPSTALSTQLSSDPPAALQDLPEEEGESEEDRERRAQEERDVRDAEALIREALGPDGPKTRHVLWTALKLFLGGWLLSSLAFLLYQWTSTSKEIVHPRWAHAAADKAIWRLLDFPSVVEALGGGPLRPGPIHTLVTRHGMARPETTIPLTVFYDEARRLHHQVRFAVRGGEGRGGAVVVADVAFPRGPLGQLGLRWQIELLVVEWPDGRADVLVRPATA